MKYKEKVLKEIYSNIKGQLLELASNTTPGDCFTINYPFCTVKIEIK